MYIGCVLGASCPGNGIQIPQEFVNGGGGVGGKKFYYSPNGLMTWLDALKACQALGGSLATFKTAEEESVMRETLGKPKETFLLVALTQV